MAPATEVSTMRTALSACDDTNSSWPPGPNASDVGAVRRVSMVRVRVHASEHRDGAANTSTRLAFCEATKLRVTGGRGR